MCYNAIANIPAGFSLEIVNMNVHNFSATDIDNIVKRYIAGESENVLSFEFGVSRRTIHNRLIACGIKTRTIKESNILRMNGMSIKDKKALTKKARGARKGSKDTPETLKKRADSRKANVGKGETLFITWLKHRGYKPSHQEPVGKYNVDIAVHPVAIEIHRHNHNPLIHKYESERSEYIRNHGWTIIYIWINKRHPLTHTSANKAITLLEFISHNPPVIGQEWVIRGDGEVFTPFSLQGEHPT